MGEDGIERTIVVGFYTGLTSFHALPLSRGNNGPHPASLRHEYTNLNPSAAGPELKRFCTDAGLPLVNPTCTSSSR